MTAIMGSDHLGLSHTNLPTNLSTCLPTFVPCCRLRIYHYYLPVFFWVESQLNAHRAKHAAAGGPVPPMVLGISAPQGCGKTTLVEQLEQLFSWQQRQVASVSIDDFYVTRKDQAALAAANPENRLLQLRGNAGTHDLGLGSATLGQLLGLTSDGSEASVPRCVDRQQAPPSYGTKSAVGDFVGGHSQCMHT